MNGSIVELDVHGMTLYQAQIAVDAALRRAGGAYRIRVIHGYRGGTALRDGGSQPGADGPGAAGVLAAFRRGSAIDTPRGI